MQINISKFMICFLIPLLIGIKLFLVANNSIFMVYGPHDDSLYLERAFSILVNGHYGDYDARLFVKLPGLSLLLASLRSIGIPYLFFINISYILTGIYLFWCLRNAEINKNILLFVFVVYLFNPVTFDYHWFRLLREPLSIILLVFMIGSMIHIVNLIKAKKNFTFPLFILTLTFALSLLNREEDFLLFFLITPFLTFVLFKVSNIQLNDLYIKNLSNFIFLLRKIKLINFLIILIPIIFTILVINLAKYNIYQNYDAYLINDFNEGEFPRLISAMRSVESKKDNRHVMITQEKLTKIYDKVPESRDLINLIPKPHSESYSCARFGVCSEWTNGWYLFWIKDAAFQTGNTNSLKEGQEYFKIIRTAIEAKCNEGELNCKYDGSALIPPFHLKWLKSYIIELYTIFDMVIFPKLAAVEHPHNKYNVDNRLGKVYQYMTMSHNYDSYNHLSTFSWDKNDNNYLSLKYWLRYPDVAKNELYGFISNKKNHNGAFEHFNQHGRAEGRLWTETEEWSPNDSIKSYKNVKNYFIKFYEYLGPILILFSFVGYLYQIYRNNFNLQIVDIVLVSFLIYFFTRSLIMAYVSVYMGSLDVRLFFSNNIVIMTLLPIFFQKMLIWKNK